MKFKALFILHSTPPVHGAAKVGDTIIESEVINKEFTTKHIKIKSSKNIDEIGRFYWLKLYFSIELFVKVLIELIVFRPKVIYYTASPQGFAFYRDLIVTFPIKLYSKLIGAKIFYHFHAKGILEFTEQSRFKLGLTNYFVKKVNLIFISELLKYEVKYLKSYASLSFLSNAVENKLSESDFNDIVSERIKKNEIKVLYLSNMIKDKGFDIVLEVAKHSKEISSSIYFDFAGAWANPYDKANFEKTVKTNKLEEFTTFHGLVHGNKKKKLFSEATLFIFPSSYKKEVFPLVVLEALSYGLPVLAFDIGAVTKIIHDKVGIISNKELIFEDLKYMITHYQSKSSYLSCREEYLNNYTIRFFEENLLRILNSNNV